MTAEQIKTYQQVFLDHVLTQKLEQNEKEIKTWNDYKKRYKQVIEGLQIFPLSVSEKCMVPVGKLALMRGRLIHTNEVLVCLGDDYFAKYSASQAIELCNRRIAKADEMLKSLEAERNLIEARQILPLEYDIFEDKDRKEILEHIDEDNLEKWRIQHRQHMKEYRQKLAKLRDTTDTRTDEDILKRFDELELEEELEDEICRLEAERKKFYGDDLNEGEVFDESENASESDGSTEEINEELKKSEDIQINEPNIDTSNVSSNTTQDKTTIDTEDEQFNRTVNSDEKKSKEGCLSDKNISEEKKRRVSFVEPSVKKDKTTEKETMSQEFCSVTKQDDTCVETISQEFCSVTKQDDICDENSTDDIRITFSHSSYSPSISALTNTEIQSPTDIYKMFSVRKSILKRSPNDVISGPIPPPPSLSDDDNTDDEDRDDSAKHSAYDAVTTEVRETQLANNTIERKEEKKIVSKFKLERAKRMK